MRTGRTTCDETLRVVYVAIPLPDDCCRISNTLTVKIMKIFFSFDVNLGGN
jgi:hypothetical protein